MKGDFKNKTLRRKIEQKKKRAPEDHKMKRETYCHHMLVPWFMCLMAYQVHLIFSGVW